MVIGGVKLMEDGDRPARPAEINESAPPIALFITTKNNINGSVIADVSPSRSWDCSRSPLSRYHWYLPQACRQT